MIKPGRLVVCIGLVLLGACAVSAPPTATHRSSVVLSAAEQQTVTAFEARVNDYVALRNRLNGTLPTVPKSATLEQVDQNQRALGALIRSTRADATQGEFFTPEFQALVKRTMAAVISGADRANTKASIMDENPGVPNLSVNDRYPDAVPLSTMPPQVLASLPTLEGDMEYRFIGERLVLMDARAHIIIDYTDDVLP